MNKPNLICKGELTIVGGKCTEVVANRLLEQWPNLNNLAYRIWEFPDRIEFVTQGLLPPAEQLERARLFGEGGDLTLRRDGTEFRWWFVGPKDISLPEGWTQKPEAGKETAWNFWEREVQTCFHEEAGTMLLWGERPPDKESFWEDRVAGANLPFEKLINKPATRVEIAYSAYTRSGRVEFVWLKKPQPHQSTGV